MFQNNSLLYTQYKLYRSNWTRRWTGGTKERKYRKGNDLLIEHEEEREKGVVDESRQKREDQRGEETGDAIDKYKKKRGYSDIMPPKIEPKTKPKHNAEKHHLLNL